jgi:hypothetical protein
MGFSPISTIGFGRTVVSSEIRVPKPPANITAFMQFVLIIIYARFLPQYANYRP